MEREWPVALRFMMRNFNKKKTIKVNALFL
jgi:hypothetical protein